MPRDCYEELEIPRTASDADIKKAYRKLALKFHPDKNKEPGAEDRFKAVSAAYEILSDPQKKSQYDQFGFDVPQQGRGAGSRGGVHFDFSDFGRGGTMHDPFSVFESFFGGKDPFASFFDDDDFFGGAMRSSRSRGGGGRSGFGSGFGGMGFGGSFMGGFGDFGGGGNVTSFTSSSSFGGGRGMTSVSSSKSTKVRSDGVKVVTTEKTITENGVARVSKTVQELHPDGTTRIVEESGNPAAVSDATERKSERRLGKKASRESPRQVAQERTVMPKKL